MDGLGNPVDGVADRTGDHVDPVDDPDDPLVGLGDPIAALRDGIDGVADRTGDPIDPVDGPDDPLVGLSDPIAALRDGIEGSPTPSLASSTPRPGSPTASAEWATPSRPKRKPPGGGFHRTPGGRQAAAGSGCWRGVREKRAPGSRPRIDQTTFGSLNASISPLNASTGTQLQNTFLSP